MKWLPYDEEVRMRAEIVVSDLGDGLLMESINEIGADEPYWPSRVAELYKLLDIASDEEKKKMHESIGKIVCDGIKSHTIKMAKWELENLR